MEEKNDIAAYYGGPRWYDRDREEEFKRREFIRQWGQGGEYTLVNPQTGEWKYSRNIDDMNRRALEELRMRAEFDAYKRSMWFKYECVEESLKKIREIIAENTKNYPHVKEEVLRMDPPAGEGDIYNVKVTWAFKIGPMGRDLITLDADQNGMRIKYFNPQYINSVNIRKIAWDYLNFRGDTGKVGDGFVTTVLKRLFNRNDYDYQNLYDMSSTTAQDAIKECITKVVKLNKFLERMEKHPLEETVKQKEQINEKITALHNEIDQLQRAATTKIEKITQAMDI